MTRYEEIFETARAALLGKSGYSRYLINHNEDGTITIKPNKPVVFGQIFPTFHITIRYDESEKNVELVDYEIMHESSVFMYAFSQLCSKDFQNPLDYDLRKYWVDTYSETEVRNF